MSKPGVFSEAIDNDQNGEDIIQKDRLKRAKKIDGDIKGKICLNRHGINHIVESNWPFVVQNLTFEKPFS